MRNLEFEANLLGIKKAKFLNAVKEASEYFHISQPKVKFWKEVCPTSSGKEQAHIHVDKKLICVSEFRLLQMNYEDVERTAKHEVTHLKEVLHNRNFHNLHANVMETTWKPLHYGSLHKENNTSKEMGLEEKEIKLETDSDSELMHEFLKSIFNDSEFPLEIQVKRFLKSKGLSEERSNKIIYLIES